MSPHATLESALRGAGFNLREGRHQVWTHPRGVVVTLPRTPGDCRAYLNDRANVRRALRRLGLAVTV